MSMEWYTFIEKTPKRNESILICISGVNRAKDNNAPILNPTYQCVFAGKYDSVVFFTKSDFNFREIFSYQKNHCKA